MKDPLLPHSFRAAGRCLAPMRKLIPVAALLILAACQHLGTARVPQEQTQPMISAEAQPETQQLPAVDGPKYPEPAVPETSEPPSDWQEALAPYLDGQTQTGQSAQTQEQVVLKPPVLQFDGDAVRVGLLLPLSGQQAPLGRAMLDAAQLALFDFSDSRFELLPHDTKGLPGEAAYAVSLAVGDGAQLMIGPLLGPSVEAVAPMARASGVPVLGFSSDRNVAGDGVYTMGFLPGAEVDRVVAYALSRGLSRFAILAPDDAYGETVTNAMSSALALYGGSLVDAAYYHPAGDDLDPVIRRLADYDQRRQALLELRAELEAKDDELSKKALERLENLETLGDLPYDALLIADGGSRLQRVAALLPFYDIDPRKVRMLGTGQWDAQAVGAEPALLGGWYAAPEPARRQTFIDRFQSVYGYAPPRLATLAYDAAALAAVLARNGAERPYTPEALMQPSGYAGRDGIFRFSAAGVAERGLAVLQVQQRGAEVIDPAPTSFATLTN